MKIERSKRLKAETHALYLAYKKPKGPPHAQVFAISVVRYAFGPIGLILDPISALGYLEDLLIVPPGVARAIRMISREVP